MQIRDKINAGAHAIARAYGWKVPPDYNFETSQAGHARQFWGAAMAAWEGFNGDAPDLDDDVEPARACCGEYETGSGEHGDELRRWARTITAYFAMTHENPKVEAAMRSGVFNAFTRRDWFDLALSAIDQGGVESRIYERIEGMLPLDEDEENEEVDPARAQMAVGAGDLEIACDTGD